VEGDAGRLNFDDISSALLTLFIITTGENWNTIMFDTMKYSGEPFWGSVYIISWYLFSNLGLVNLFVAVILGNFEEDDDVKAAYQERKYKALVMVSQELKAFVLQHQRYVARLADVLAEKDGEGALNKGPLAIDTAAPGPHEAASASTQAEQLAMEAGMVPIASSVLLMADGKIAPTPRIDVARRTSMPQNRSFTFGPFTARPENDGDDSAAS
ncbi:CACNA1E, partial [Symbiodinium sp. KB8]